MKASDVMTKKPIWWCRENSPVREVAKMMAEHDVGAIAACDNEGRLQGIVTDRDICCRLVAKGGTADMPVSKIMSKDVQCVSGDADMETIESIMRTKKIRRVPVVDRSRHLQGFVSLSDIAHHCKSAQEEHAFLQVLTTICAPLH